MTPNEPAPWPVTAIMATFTAAFLIAAMTTTDPALVTVTSFFAAICATITANLAFCAALYRIRKAGNRPSPR